MEGTTSTSNEGSKKRNLDNYKSIETESISVEDFDKLLEANDYTDPIRFNFIGFDVRSNVKESESNPVSASSADTYVFDINDVINLRYVVWLKPHDITKENAEKIGKLRNRDKKRRAAEKEAREAKEAEEFKELKQDSIEENKNSNNMNR